MKKLLFVFNPHSGKAKIKDNLLDIIDSFVKNGCEVTVYPTQAPLDCYQKIRDQSQNYDLIVTSGGDGTLNEAVRGLMESQRKPLLGYIPTGTTNDFASSLGIPKNNMIKAAEIAVNGNPFCCDIGSFNNLYFTYIAAFGIFTGVAYQTPQQYKNMLGHMAYVLEGIKSLNSVKPYHMRVEVNEEIIEDDFIFGMVSNSISVGGFKGLSNNVDIELNDGLFEVVLIKMPKSMYQLQQTVSDLLWINRESKNIYMRKSSDVVFHSEKLMPWTLDGEFGGDEKDVTIKNCKKALNIMTPPYDYTEDEELYLE